MIIKFMIAKVIFSIVDDMCNLFNCILNDFFVWIKCLKKCLLENVGVYFDEYLCIVFSCCGRHFFVKLKIFDISYFFRNTPDNGQIDVNFTLLLQILHWNDSPMFSILHLLSTLCQLISSSSS